MARPYRYPNAYFGNGVWKGYYLDEYGNRDTVWLDASSAISNSFLYDTINKWIFNGIYYTFPEYLTVQAFINKFQYTWAFSLLGYHAEFFYWKRCIDEVTQPELMEFGDTLNTHEFDNLIWEHPELLLQWNSDTVCDHFADSILMKDPFFNSSFGQQLLDNRWFRPYKWNAGTGGCVQVKSAYMRMKEKMLNYGNSGASIFELATAIAACSATTTCNLQNDTLAATWVKDFYVRLKEEIIMEYLHKKAQWDAAYNGAIGPNSKTYYQLWYFYPCSSGSGTHPYSNTQQISNSQSQPTLKNKIKRWGRTDEIMGLDSNITNGDVSGLSDTIAPCRCDNAEAINTLIKFMFQYGNLLDTMGINQCSYNLMTPQIGNLIGSAFIYTAWLSNNDKTLHIKLDTSDCALPGGEQIILDLSNAASWATFTFDSILSIQNLQYTYTQNGIRHFTMSYWAMTDSLELETVEGQTCLPIDICEQDFTCTANCLFDKLDQIIQFLNTQSALNATYHYPVTPDIRKQFGCLFDEMCKKTGGIPTELIWEPAFDPQNPNIAILYTDCDTTCPLVFDANKDWTALPQPLNITGVGLHPCTPLADYPNCCGANMVWYFTDAAGKIDSIVADISFKCGTPLDLFCCDSTNIAFGSDSLACMDIPPVSLPSQEDPCLQDMYNNAAFNAQTLYNQYIDSLKQDFFAQYKKVCRKIKENFTLDWEIPGNYWTVYQYDEAGNLLQTVPPNGIDILDALEIAQADQYRKGISTTPVYPNHTLTTDYRYNTQNLVVAQRTPDGGTTRMYYDKAFRIAASQNDRQQPDSIFSYTRYDYKGRPVESGIGTSATNTPPTKNTLSNGQHPNNWLSNKKEVVSTLYDVPYDNNTWQTNLRNRVSAVSRDENGNGTIEQAYVYSYDILGNVNEMRSYTKALKKYNHHWKRLLYDYDLISGKVTRVSYQPNQPDQLIHRYTYDADNRLIGVWTTQDGWYWEQDAHYLYYLHGPLKRAVIGERQVQGLDYIYTLNGWIKTLNNHTTDSTLDAGGDGLPGGWNQYVAKDKLAYQLQYFHGDYKAIGNFTAGSFGQYVGLFNGNIAATLITQDTLVPYTYSYRYDALNRLRSRSTFKNNQSVLSYTSAYTYDKMGNILTLNRYAGNAPMDSLQYFYNANTNQLNHVTDKVAASAFGNDIDSQNANNYKYEATGNLKKDVSEQLKINWTHYGKVKKIKKAGNDLLVFKYDATGNRIIKNNKQTNSKQIYLRDAQGNVMAVYRDRGDTLTLLEQHLYGSSRLGIIKADKFLTKKQYLTNPPPISINLYNIKMYKFGIKQYELTDWLGNVRVVINDKKTPLGTNASNMTYNPQTVSVSSFWPFGMLSKNYESGYRYGFNGQEKVDEISGTGNHNTALFWEYDTRLGIRWNLDPKPQVFISDYAVMANNPILFNDVLGDKVKYKSFGDRIRVGITRLINKNFNKDFKTKKDDKLNTFTYSRDANAASRLKDAKAELNLLDAPVDGYGTLANQYDVKYKNWELGKFDDTYGADALKLPFEITWSIGKLSVGSLTGIGIGIANVFGANIGWGMANRLSFHTGANLFSFGFGNYNKYNMFGMRLGSLPGKSPKIYPKNAPGLLGFRLGIGKNQPVNFIDILGEVYNRKGFGYHFHINATSRRTKKRQLSGENTIDIKN